MIDLNQIYCGDCLELMKELDDNSVDLVLTDPPNFVPVQASVGKRKGYHQKSLGDLMVIKPFYDLVLKGVMRTTTSASHVYIFCDAKSYPILFQSMYPYFKHVRLLIWDKIVSYNGYTWRHQHELIAWGEQPDSIRIPTGDGDVIKCRGVLDKDKQHDAQKPIEIIKKLIGKHESEIILDPFAGSGTTLVAAKELGRQFIGFEISEEYCTIARERLKQEVLKL